MRIAPFAVAVWCASCARPRPVTRADEPATDRRDETRRYTIWLGGARVGTATETELWTTTGVTLRRREELRFLRGDSAVQLTTEIVIDADRGLHARRVRWTQGGGEERVADATRADDGWHVSTGAHLPADAEPAELVPLLVRRDRHFAGAVFLPARGFVVGHGTIEAVTNEPVIASASSRRRLIAQLALDEGPMVEATIDLDADGSPARVVDGEGVIEVRASEAQGLESFTPVDLISATSIPIEGTRLPGTSTSTSRLLLAGDFAIPALPGQRATPLGDSVSIELSPALPGAMPAEARGRDRTADIRTLVTAVRQRITPSLAAGPASTRAAADATAGDCTTFALAYAALASQRGIPTRVVTGLRVDDHRLVRHRWAVSWTGTRWIAIDAAFGQAPAGGDLIGLAIHDADDAGLVAGEAALVRVHRASWD